MRILNVTLIALLFTATVVTSKTFDAWDNETSKGTSVIDVDVDDVDDDEDNELVAACIGIAERTKGVSGQFNFIAISGVGYTGDDLWQTGEYDVEVKIERFEQGQEGTFEGPAESNIFEFMILSIRPPPQGVDMPNIARVSGKALIKIKGGKAKAAI